MGIWVDKYTGAKSVNPDQTAPRSSLIRVYTVCRTICIVKILFLEHLLVIFLGAPILGVLHKV